MRRTLVALITIACAATASAQINSIRTTPGSGGSSASGFSFGPRISNYSTDIDGGLATLKTGRQSSFGAVGDYRTGNFVLDFNYDHDPENGIRVTDIIFDVGNYSRDKGEVTVGLAVAPILDVQGGIRFDTVRIGGASIFGNAFGTDLNIDHQALTAGVKLHTGDGQQVGFYVLGRGYLGSAKFDVVGRHVNSDSSGFRAEGGLTIRIGESNWSIVPGVEYDHIETKDFDLRLNTNRFFLNFVYRAGT